MIKIINAEKDMEEQLKNLWNTCFEHDEEFCEFFFNNRFAPQKALVAVDNGKICSALHFFDGFYKDSRGKVKPALYIYGVATYPEFRKKGYASMLIDELKARAAKHNICALYLTAEESAWNCYERAGFKRNARLSRTDFVPHKCSNIQWQSCEFEKFSKLRGKYLDTLNDTFLWCGRELEFMYRDINRDGQMLCTTYDGREYYAAVRLRDDELTIIETSFPRENGDILAGSIAAHFGQYDTVSIFGREDEFFSGGSVIKKENFYIGHTLFIDNDISSKSMYMNLLAD